MRLRRGYIVYLSSKPIQLPVGRRLAVTTFPQQPRLNAAISGLITQLRGTPLQFVAAEGLIIVRLACLLVCSPQRRDNRRAAGGVVCIIDTGTFRCRRRPSWGLLSVQMLKQSVNLSCWQRCLCGCLRCCHGACEELEKLPTDWRRGCEKFMRWLTRPCEERRLKESFAGLRSDVVTAATVGVPESSPEAETAMAEDGPTKKKAPFALTEASQRKFS
jgi:hypothetical protein